ncbi:hypothetical protein QVD17_07012 [Tagetes erecta]|uniref:Uncharacterized protein n=1 Tax=Tagetes erecta TaxID=13708 RepID=A0AAD8LGM4_TARER|nr:hypothetical protein QVD17_07012 [Tagetes erecta]
MKLLGVDPNTHKQIEEAKGKNFEVMKEQFYKSVSANETTHADRYNMVCMNYDVDSFTNNIKSTSISCSDSYSLEHPIWINNCSSLGGSSLVEGDHSLQQWVDGEGSLTLWDDLKQQEDLFFMLGK